VSRSVGARPFSLFLRNSYLGAIFCAVDLACFSFQLLNYLYIASAWPVTGSAMEVASKTPKLLIPCHRELYESLMAHLNCHGLGRLGVAILLTLLLVPRYSHSQFTSLPRIIGRSQKYKHLLRANDSNGTGKQLNLKRTKTILPIADKIPLLLTTFSCRFWQPASISVTRAFCQDVVLYHFMLLQLCSRRCSTSYICTLDEYMTARPDNIGTNPSFVSALGQDLPHDVM
jgi:hypothetical protein